MNFRVRPLDLCQLDYLVGVDFSFAHGGTDEALLGRLLIWAVLISALLLKACSDSQRVLYYLGLGWDNVFSDEELAYWLVELMCYQV